MLLRAGDNRQDALSGKTQKEAASDQCRHSRTQRRGLDSQRKKKNSSYPEKYNRSADRGHQSRKQKSSCSADLI